MWFIGSHLQRSSSKQATVARAGPPTSVCIGQRHVLLVGVTWYPNLSERYQLRGPDNDVVFIEQLLRVNFGIPRTHIVVLSGDAGAAKWLPTRTNIVRDFQSLAEKVEGGDYVVIYLAGHGSR